MILFIQNSPIKLNLGQIFALIPSTVNRYIRFSQAILSFVLRGLPEATIQWPTQDAEFHENSCIIQERHPLLNGAIGSMDGLKTPVQNHPDAMWENAMYNGWLHEHYVSSVFVFSPKGVIMMCTLNCPGSWHDSRVAREIYDTLETKTPEEYYLVADSAFPQGAAHIAGKIKVPLRQGQLLPSDPQAQDEQLAFDRQLLSYRQTAEWGMRGLQGSFPRLHLPLDANDHDGRLQFLENCSRLYNVRAVLVGINQIRSVYVPIWREWDDERLWEGFEHMLFRDVARGSRVARFHASNLS